MVKEIESKDLDKISAGGKEIPLDGRLENWLLTAPDGDLIFWYHQYLKPKHSDKVWCRNKIEKALINRGYQVTDNKVYKDGKVVPPEDY